ncbi:hypothetical protein F7725_028481, partial [Dissostichus mawsoni]
MNVERLLFITPPRGNTSPSSSSSTLCDEHGNVPLHWAVERNRTESCRALLDLGADPNLLNTALMSPLHLATGHDITAHINYLDKSNSSPLHLAVRGGNIEAITFCIAKGAK